ncbi:MAG: M1 family metallopeptidase [Phycisphaerales bacterium]
MRHRALVALFSILISAAALPAQDEGAPPRRSDPRIDPETGRALANYPHPRHFDHRHMRLEMSIADIAVKEFSATQTLRVAAVGSARSTLVLDARSTIAVQSITLNGAPAFFTHADARLTVTLPQPALPDQEVSLVITYTAKDPFGEGVGLNWFKGKGTEGSAPPVIFSQGEANWNSYWFPCHDFPNEKLATEIIVDVASEFEVVSNGRLVSKSALPGTGDAPARTRWHWSQDKPHSNYLVMLAISKWDVVDLGGPSSARPGMPITIYGRVGTAETLRKVFANTPAMVAHFEKLFDEPYPWDKYAQVLVRGFRWGGMENTSATILIDSVGGGEAGGLDDLISHELAHQWFGNLVTCNSWEHLWLNEGWATLSEALWEEHARGPEAYARVIRRSLEKQQRTNRGSAPAAIPMVSNLWKNADETFEKTDDVYSKGGVILHMLRRRLGDEVFWRGTRLYLDRFKFACAETDDFRKVMEEVSGESLQAFFDQWCLRPGIPRLSVAYDWDATTSELIIALEQTQTINADNPAYAFDLPFVCALTEGTSPACSIPMNARTAQARFKLPSRPTRIRIDPDMTVAAQFRVTKRLPAAEKTEPSTGN